MGCLDNTLSVCPDLDLQTLLTNQYRHHCRCPLACLFILLSVLRSPFGSFTSLSVVRLPVYLSVCLLSTRLSVYLSVCLLSARLSVYLSVCLVSARLSVYLSVRLLPILVFICPFDCLFTSAFLLICPSVVRSAFCLFLHLSAAWFVRHSTRSNLCDCVCAVLVCVCVCVCVLSLIHI